MRGIDLKDRIVAKELRDAARDSGSKVFLQFGNATHTFAEIHDATNRASNALGALGVEGAGRVGIFARNSYAFVLSWFAAAKLGAYYVPINTEYKGDILHYQLSDAEVTLLVIDPEFLDRLVDVIAQLPLLSHVIISSACAVPNALAAHCTVLFVDELLSGDTTEVDIDHLSYDHPIAISFTSGTTGPSKGVIASNAHVINFALDWSRLMAYQPGVTIYTPLPLFHAIGAWMGVLPALLYRNRVCISPRFSASEYWDEVRRAKADIAHGIFSMVPILLKQPPTDDDAFQPARAFYNGNASPDFEERFNIQIIEAYGATESGIVAGTPFGEKRKGLSCGKVNDQTFEVLVVDGDDQPLPFGQPGELLVRPRQPFVMFSGYHNKAAATLEAFRNMWFHTGDHCRLDEDGSLYFIDRMRDTIRRRGENISSFELESAINTHPGVLECAAVPVVSPLGEDEVKIVITPLPDTEITPEEFWAFCDAKLPRFWVPSYLEFRTDMPKTGNQKIQKFQLKSIGEDCDTYVRDWKSSEISMIRPAK